MDPTRQRNQPALTTSSGSVWLIVGGLLAVISLVVLIPEIALAPAGVAVTGVVLVVALYLGMLLVRWRVQPGRVRLGILAGLMIAIAGAALVCTLIVAGAQA